MLHKIVLMAMLVGLVLGFSVSCCGQVVYVFEPTVELHWDGANIDGLEPPASFNNYYVGLQRNKGETNWASADTVFTNFPHIAMDAEHVNRVLIAGAQPGTYEYLIQFISKEGVTVIAVAECQIPVDVIYLEEAFIPGCGARR